MPFRIVGYDGAAYRSQLQQERKKMLPVMTIVLYFGTDRHWNSRKKIKELMEIPRCLDTYVNDYQMHVFEVAWLTEEQISHFHSDFKVVANFFVQKRKNKDYIPDDPTEIRHVDEVLKLLQVMTGDRRYEEIFRKKKEGVHSMCDVAESYIEASGIKKIAYFIRAYMNIEKEMRRNKPDIVHIHMSYRGSFYRKYAIHKLCKKYGVPDVIHLHGSEFQKWYNESDDRTKEKIRTLLRESASFIVLGEKWNKAIHDIEPKTKTVVVSNTVPVPNYTTSWNEKRFQFLFLGVLIKRKGVADLIQAISLLKKEGSLNNIKFVIAGSGAEEANLKQQARELQVESWIEFAGWTDGKAKERYLKDSQALVLPSYNEGLPMAVLEAISYGLPVIATDVGDMAAAVRDGENGYLIHPGDVEAIADAILKVSNKNQYDRFSKFSKELAITKFNEDGFFEQILKVYQG